MIGGVITAEKLADLHKQEEELFVKLHPKSNEISSKLKSNWLGGVPMPWMNRLPGSFPLTVDDANGAHFTDADSITYTDFCLGDTGAMTGHAVPQVAEAVSERVRRGITTMMPSSDAAYVSSELSRRFGLPLWQMAMTATDANRFVLRYARYITKKPKIVVMDWCYHGTVDETLAVLNEQGQIVPRPGAIGPQCDVNITTRVAHFNDIESLENCFKNGDCACLLMEPALTNIGIVLPLEGYLTQVKELCVKYNVLLIIDETHTICCSPGGCTASWKLQPDFLVIGKPIGGGMPAAAYGMTQAVADELKQHLLDDSVDVSGVGGTLTGNALALAAVKATLSSTLREEDYAYMIPLATAWTTGVNNTIKEFNLPWNVQQLGCRSEYWFCPPPINGAQAAATSFHELENYLHLFCLNREILLTPFHNMALFSPQHTMEDVDKHTKVFREGVISLVEAMKAVRRGRRVWTLEGILKEKCPSSPLNGSFLQRTLPMLFKESDFTKAYLSVFSDSDGKLGKVIQSLKMTKEERVRWLKMWLEIDVDGNNKMSYEEYLDFLYMTDNVYIKRSFDVMNSSFTGVVTFLELLVFASRYLSVDKESTIELCFRLISRRGSLFNPKISILDVDDFKEFIRVQYDNKNLTKAKKRAMNIFTYIDADGDGGLDIQEFSKFCDINPVFVRFTHTIQQHLRKVMFGIAYWVEKTRVIKYSLATGFAALTTLSMINSETEKWTVDMLKQPVIDASSRPLRIAQYKPPPPSKEILDKEEDAVALAEAATAFKAASRVNVAWKGPFDMKLLKKNKYEDDFSEVEIRSKERKAAKDKKRRDELKRLNILTSKTQDKMVQAINDLLTGRRALRIAYSTWLNVVGLESKTGNIMPNASENDDGDTAATDDTNIDIHEKILKMERDLKADQTKESLTMDYIRVYIRNKADKHVLLEACKDRVLHLPDSIANVRSIYNILPPASKSRPSSKK